MPTPASAGKTRFIGFKFEQWRSTELHSTRRALERSGELPRAIDVIRRAAAEIDEPSGEAACVALAFVEELEQRKRELG